MNVNLLLGVLFGLYVLAIIYLRFNKDKLPEWMSITGGILILVKTQRGIDTIGKIADSTDKWKPWGNAGVIFAILVMIGSFVFMVVNLYLLLTNPVQQSISNPKNYLVIPGVNDFIPLTVVFEVAFALLFAMIIHEFGHALYCKYEGIGIDSTGLVLLGILPIGAFVEPNEENQEKASKNSRLRMFSAGVFNNAWMTIVSLGLLILFTSVLITPVAGIHIANSENADIERGDIITKVNGQEVDGSKTLTEVLQDDTSKEVDLVLNNKKSITVDKKLIISGVIESSELESGSEIVKINDKPVTTISEAKNIIYSQTSNTISIETDKNTVEYTTGALYVVTEDTKIDSTELSRNSLVKIISYNGNPIHSSEQIENLESGATVTIEKDNTQHTITLPSGSSEYLNEINGVNGLEFSQIRVSEFESEVFYAIVSGAAISEIGIGLWLLTLFFAPFGSLVGFNQNFPGFTSTISNFYTVTDPVLVGIEPIIMFGLTTLYWSFWLNFNLFIFNCIPTFALDGGHILRDAFDICGEKLGLSEDTIIAAKSSVLLATIGILLIVLFYPIIAG